MRQSDDRSYYQNRAKVSQELAKRTANPMVAFIHLELANRYEMLAAGPRQERSRLLQAVQAA